MIITNNFICKIDCVDTPMWRDEQKNDCSHYTSWCENGAVKSGSDWAMGSHYNHPENNCCICGKGKENPYNMSIYMEF